MIFKRFLHKQGRKYFRLRVESCVETILDLDQRLGDGRIKPEIVEQFRRLRDSLQYVTDDSVDEKDINRIEEATNHLLQEMKQWVGDENLTTFHEGTAH
ncbi:MAG: hypothetical protein MUF52_05020 [Syntrophobacteraceae bacterium]|jgi:hypothetical protein|nr:hypothetical protein [Syntrophobacteraceae bacterium]MCU0587501.1 hypothetical protein [Syntrophobacteraceae bacterium]